MPQVECIGQKYYVDKKMVGQVIMGDEGSFNVYYKKVKKAFRFAIGVKMTFGIQKAVLEDCRERYVTHIKLYEADTDIMYLSRLEDWFNEGHVRNYPKFGSQLFLPLSLMEKM